MDGVPDAPRVSRSVSALGQQAKPPKKTVKKKQSSKITSSNGSLCRKRKTPGRRAQRFQSSRRGGAVSARQSADFEGLSRVEEAHSESVDDFVQEGNVCEAGRA